MPQITEVHERLALYKAAERTILETNQSYQIGQQVFTKANIMFIRQEIARLEQQLEVLQQQHGSYCAQQTIIGGRR